MKFYGKTKPLYIETDVSGVGLGAAFLQTRSNTSTHRDGQQHPWVHCICQQEPHRGMKEIQEY